MGEVAGREHSRKKMEMQSLEACGKARSGLWLEGRCIEEDGGP